MSCAGNGYLTGNMMIPFPFEDGQSLSWGLDPEMSRTAQQSLQACVVDAMVHVMTQSIPDAEWPALGMFSVSERSLGFGLSAGGAYVPMSVSESGSRFPIVSGRAGWGAYSIVLSSEGIRGFLDLCNANSISPPASGRSSSSGRDWGLWLRLCPRCVSVTQGGISSIRVYDGVMPPDFNTSEGGYAVGEYCSRLGKTYVCVSDVMKYGKWSEDDWEYIYMGDVSSREPDMVIHGDVKVVPGYNMRLSDPGGDGNGVELNAIPGAGLGAVPCKCQESEQVSRPFFSPDGHTRFFNDTCYDLEPRVVSNIDGGKLVKRVGYITVHAKCTACCTCKMYESIVNDRLAGLFDEVKKARETLDSLLLEYEDAVMKFNSRLSEPKASDAQVSLSGMPTSYELGPKLDGTNIRGKMDRCAYTATFRNTSFQKMTVRIMVMSATDIVVESSATWSDSAGNPLSKTNPSGDLVGNWFDIYPGRSLVVTYVSVRTEMSNGVSNKKYRSTFSVGVTYTKSLGGGARSLGTFTRRLEV